MGVVIYFYQNNKTLFHNMKQMNEGNMGKVITLGEPMVVWIPLETGDFSEVKSFSKGIAGAELNVAIGIARLGHEVAYVTKLGTDIYGDYLLKCMENENIDVSYIAKMDDHLTGAYFKTKVLEGDPSVHYLRKNSAASCMEAKDIEQIDFQGTQILHVTGIAAAVSKNCMEACKAAIKKAHEAGVLVTFDPNIRPALWESKEAMIEQLNNLAFQCNMVMPGIAEGKILTGKETPEEIAEFYITNGVDKVVIKLGDKGAYYKEKSSEGLYVEGFKVDEIVDTVGAGDAFAAGMITGLLEGEPIAKVVKRANAMGAIMVTSIGDNDAMPTREYLMEYMRG